MLVFADDAVMFGEPGKETVTGVRRKETNLLWNVYVNT